MKKKVSGKFLLGASIGAGIALLFSTKKGAELRKSLKQKLDELVGKAKEIDVEDVKNEFAKRIDKLKTDLEDLDKEKALALAKEKGAQLKKEAEELFNLAKEKGTPVLENMAKDIKKKTADVIREVLKKLES